MHAALRPAIPAALLATALLGACSGGGGDPGEDGAYAWSLDLDLSGDTVLTGIRGDAEATANVNDAISGRVNGFDSAVAEDTLRFVNQEYDQFLVNAPLAADGTFRFDGAELLGELDGSMTLVITLRTRTPARPPRPDTIFLSLARPCGGRPC